MYALQDQWLPRWYHGATAHPLITQKRVDIARICRRLHIQRVEVLGSAARGTDVALLQSDADVLLEFVSGAKRGLEGYFSLKS